MTAQFERFAAIDWSGAKGKRHKGIAVAVCAAGDNSCLMQIDGLLHRRGAAVRCMHLAEILAATDAGGSLPAKAGSHTNLTGMPSGLSRKDEGRGQ